VQRLQPVTAVNVDIHQHQQLLRVTSNHCHILAAAGKQTSRDTSSRKTISSHLKTRFYNKHFTYIIGLSSCVCFVLVFLHIFFTLFTITVRLFIPHSARTGRTVFSQLSAAVVRHKAKDGAVYAIRAWFKYNTALSAVV